MTNETFSYSNWNVGEPNNGGASIQDVLWMYGYEAYRTASTQYIPGEWDDMYGEMDVFPSSPLNEIGYVVEYELGQSVPEPSTLAILALSLAGLGFSRRKKAK